jgi:hypothetical protein
MKRMSLLVSLFIFCFISPVLAQSDMLAEIRDVGAYEVKSDGFVLDADQQISIHAVADSDRYRGVGTSVWILNETSREVVWRLKNARQHNRSHGLAEYDDAVQLSKGEYEVYYAAYPEPSDGIESFGDFVDFLSGRIFDGNRHSREYRDLTLTVNGHGQHVGREGVDRWQEDLKKNALLSLSALWDNDYAHQGFVLEKPAEVTVYAIGELQDDNLDDYGWIINAKTGKRVWEMRENNTKNAGGARKNRLVRETISLPAGQYAAFFVTDDSHSYKNWNSPPPYDPAFWGITLWIKDEALRKYAKLYDYRAAEAKNIIADLTRLGDHESQSKAFTLKKAMDVRVYAVGEGHDRDMADYGWIVDASTRKKVWTMEYDETEHAGGDSKNRMVDKIVHLEKGSYIVHFITDDSHSYHHWNSSPPFDPEHWGITISAAGDRFDPKDVSAYEERGDASVLASIVRVGNDERRRKEFSLSQKSDVHIYALGEGSDGDMSDYAWIENASTRKVVWEMRYRMTDPAGGAHKNRLFDGTITLPAGTYVVFYETDGSHAYNDWNDTPPDDPEAWGITISLAKGEQR